MKDGTLGPVFFNWTWPIDGGDSQAQSLRSF